ncbi:MAG: beta-aryl ether-cleaving protein [Hyphomicrobiales bacterium]|nr:MAG: beta-aryl ether-cleaving protein [Hyphomicrobiales bacterium]
MAIKIYELCGKDETRLFSPHCWKTRLSLAHKGLDWDTIPTQFVDVAGLEGGEKRTVPTIRDGDTVLHESYQIACYLEDQYPDKPSLFNGEGGKELSKFLISWSQGTLHPLVAQLCMLDIHNLLDDENRAFFRKSREAMFGITLEEFDQKFAKDNTNLVKAMLPLENLLKRQPYLGGDTPLFADYVVFGPLQWLRVSASHDVMPKEGAVADWFARLLDMYDGIGRKASAGFTAA